VQIAVPVATTAWPQCSSIKGLLHAKLEAVQIAVPMATAAWPQYSSIKGLLHAKLEAVQIATARPQKSWIKAPLQNKIVQSSAAGNTRGD
jgi:hypothetical protein